MNITELGSNLLTGTSGTAGWEAEDGPRGVCAAWTSCCQRERHHAGESSELPGDAD